AVNHSTRWTDRRRSHVLQGRLAEVPVVGIHRQTVSGGVSRPLAGSGGRGTHRHGAGADDPDSPLSRTGNAHRDASTPGNDCRDPSCTPTRTTSIWSGGDPRFAAHARTWRLFRRPSHKS